MFGNKKKCPQCGVYYNPKVCYDLCPHAPRDEEDR